MLDLEVLLEIRVTELLYDVVVVRTLHHVINPHDVFAFEQLQDLYFGEEGSFEVVVVLDLIEGGVLSFFSSILMAHSRFVPSCSPR